MNGSRPLPPRFATSTTRPAKFNSTAITPRKLLKRLPSGLVLDGKYADDLGYLHRIHSFEERLRQARVRIDWSKI